MTTTGTNYMYHVDVYFDSESQHSAPVHNADFTEEILDTVYRI
jgi:predicted TIM-barrel enzyme